MNKKRIMLSILIAVICLGLVGVTYAAFNYSRNGLINSKQIVGDIYMHYRESNVLTLSNAMPSSTYDSTKYFEFTIDGKNTYTKKDIYYEIDLTHGDNPNIEGRTIRLNDQFLKFRLVEVVNNEEVEKFTNKSYNDLTNKRIHVETIPKNTTSEITKTYRIYMWIDNNLRIGNNNADYSVEDWNKIYASIKVNVSGDFEEKSMATPASCFTTLFSNNEVTITGYNPSCETDVVIPSTLRVVLTPASYTLNDLTDPNNVEELNSCVSYAMNTIGGFASNTDAESFCQGTGEVYGNTFQGYLDSAGFPQQFIDYFLEHNIISQTEAIISAEKYPVTTIGEYAFAYKQLTSVVIPNSVTTIGHTAFQYNQLTSVEIPNSVATIGDGAFQNNQLTSVTIGNSVTTIGESAFSHNQLTSVEIPNSVTTIGESAFSHNQLTSVEIPNSVTTLERLVFGYNQLINVTIPDTVTTIGSCAFCVNQLTSISIPNRVTIIDYSAFSMNQLTSVNIPDSVTTIGFKAFNGNQLSNVTIGNGITSIGMSAFYKSNDTNINNNVTYYNNPNLTSITIDKSCSDIKNNLLSNGTNYYPWLSDSSPYTGLGGVTIYGSNNEVCDTF